jgi:hypothetical protein
MPELQVRVRQSDTTRRSSAAVWSECPLDAIRNRVASGILVDDDFDTFYATANRYVISGTSATCAPVLAQAGGEVKLSCTNSANGEAYLGGAIKLGSFGQIISGSVDPLWFETRVKTDDITNGVVFCGLAKSTDVAAAMWADTTLVPATTVSAVGFRTLVATPSRLDCFYMDDAAAVVYATGAATLVAGTYVKLGIRFDGTVIGTKSNLVHFFVNGVEVAQATTNALGVAASATTFPDGIGLTPFWGTKTNASAAIGMTIDWYQAAMLINDSTFG